MERPAPTSLSFPPSFFWYTDSADEREENELIRKEFSRFDGFHSSSRCGSSSMDSKGDDIMGGSFHGSASLMGWKSSPRPLLNPFAGGINPPSASGVISLGLSDPNGEDDVEMDDSINSSGDLGDTTTSQVGDSLLKRALMDKRGRSEVYIRERFSCNCEPKCVSIFTDNELAALIYSCRIMDAGTRHTFVVYNLLH
jgi:hypothetical protein